MADETYKNCPLLTLVEESEWFDWLVENHRDVTSAWLKIAKKNSGVSTISYEEARDTAIAFGWIDGLINRFEGLYYVTRFTPRKPKSVWSKINCDIAEQLIADGKMHEAGLAHVLSAKAAGRWERAYAGGGSIEVPTDFSDALDQSQTAKAKFQTIDRANRYAFLYRLQTASTPELRSSRIVKYVAMLEAGELFH